MNFLKQQIPIETDHKIKFLEQVGWCDPNVKDPMKKTISYLDKLSFENHVYPKVYMEATKPPACAFLPEDDVLEKIIKVAMKYTFEGRHIALAKHFDVEHEKPEYMNQPGNKSVTDTVSQSRKDEIALKHL